MLHSSYSVVLTEELRNFFKKIIFYFYQFVVTCDIVERAGNKFVPVVTAINSVRPHQTLSVSNETPPPKKKKKPACHDREKNRKVPHPPLRRTSRAGSLKSYSFTTDWYEVLMLESPSINLTT